MLDGTAVTYYLQTLTEKQRQNTYEQKLTKETSPQQSHKDLEKKGCSESFALVFKVHRTEWPEQTLNAHLCLWTGSCSACSVSQGCWQQISSYFGLWTIRTKKSSVGNPLFPKTEKPILAKWPLILTPIWLSSARMEPAFYMVQFIHRAGQTTFVTAANFVCTQH